MWGWGFVGPTVTVGIAGEHDSDEWEGLPAGNGREEVFGLCSACHSLKLVVQQGLSRPRWEDVLDWMVEEQEMEAPEPADRKLMLDYLARFYGHDRRAKH